MKHDGGPVDLARRLAAIVDDWKRRVSNGP